MSNLPDINCSNCGLIMKGHGNYTHFDTGNNCPSDTTLPIKIIFAKYKTYKCEICNSIFELFLGQKEYTLNE